MKQEELNNILDAHRKWVSGCSDGARANLSGANLSWANLSGANLSWANLSGANLSWADLSGANLSRADLSGANLSGANLSRANLSWADLSGANLSGANLSGANLSGANLSGANLSGANLSWANLSGAKNSNLATAITEILPREGEVIGWKKCAFDVLIKVRVPPKAKRSNSTGRKCRAEFVEVLDVIGGSEGVSVFDEKTIYKTGETVRCDSWCEDRWTECGGGIHFFLTREEAENYQP